MAQLLEMRKRNLDALAEPSSQPVDLPPRLAIALVLLAVIFFGLIRYRLRDMPLERDEGEYAYAGQLLCQGIPPYKLAYNMKLPGIYAAYAVVLSVFGETPTGIHEGLLWLNAATTLVLYWLVTCLLGRLAAVVAACSFALLSTSTSVMGFEAHATNFVVLPATLGILLLLYASRRQAAWLAFAAGICLGIAFLMKQHGLFFILFGLVFLIQGERRLRTLATYSAGVVLPYSVTCLLLLRAGVFRHFWFWTVSYAGEYSKVGMRRAIRAFLENFHGVVTPAVAIWILAAIGCTTFFWSPVARSHQRLLGWLLLFSFLALCPGAYFRPHYFVLLLPATAILAGLAVTSAAQLLSNRGRSRWIPAALFLLCFTASVFMQRNDYFFLSPAAVFDRAYPGAPFVAAVNAATLIRQNSTPDQSVAVLGSEPEIYFYAHRHSATGYMYMYSLTERQKYTTAMRDEVLHELESNRPAFVVYVDAWDSWGNREVPFNAPFISRLQQFMNQGYETIAAFDITGAASPAPPKDSSSSPKRIYVLRRKPG